MENRIDVALLSESQLQAKLKHKTKLKSVLYYDPRDSTELTSASAWYCPTCKAEFAAASAPRYANPYTLVPDELGIDKIIDEIPDSHLLSHFPKRRDCPGCEAGKIEKVPAYRTKPNGSDKQPLEYGQAQSSDAPKTKGVEGVGAS